MARPLVKYMPYGQVAQFLDVLVRSGLTANLIQAVLRDSSLAASAVKNLEKESGEGKYVTLRTTPYPIVSNWLWARYISGDPGIYYQVQRPKQSSRELYKPVGVTWVELLPSVTVRDAADHTGSIFVMASTDDKDLNELYQAIVGLGFPPESALTVVQYQLGTTDWSPPV